MRLQGVSEAEIIGAQKHHFTFSPSGGCEAVLPASEPQNLSLLNFESLRNECLKEMLDSMQGAEDCHGGAAGQRPSRVGDT